MATHHNQFFNDSTLTKVALNKRLEDSVWGFFLLLIGTLLLLPSALVPQGAWLIGAGLIVLLLNGVRYVNDISVSRFTVVLGLVAVLVGLASFFGLSRRCLRYSWPLLIKHYRQVFTAAEGRPAQQMIR
jgi:hypothetical protein